MIKLMILRTQTPCGLVAYNYFACDLPTFFYLKNSAYRFTAVLLIIYFTDHVQYLFTGILFKGNDLSAYRIVQLKAGSVVVLKNIN